MVLHVVNTTSDVSCHSRLHRRTQRSWRRPVSLWL